MALQAPFSVTVGANEEPEPATHEVIRSRNAIKGVPALLGDATRAPSLNPTQPADLLGSSKRTAQGGETKRADPSSRDLTTFAAHVYPHGAKSAADLAAAMLRRARQLGLS